MATGREEGFGGIQHQSAGEAVAVRIRGDGEGKQDLENVVGEGHLKPGTLLLYSNEGFRLILRRQRSVGFYLDTEVAADSGLMFWELALGFPLVAVGGGAPSGGGGVTRGTDDDRRPDDLRLALTLLSLPLALLSLPLSAVGEGITEAEGSDDRLRCGARGPAWSPVTDSRLPPASRSLHCCCSACAARGSLTTPTPRS